MIHHTVEVTDSSSRSMRILIRLNDSGQGSWETLDKGHFCFERGVADTGYYPTSPLAWVALYGGNRVDDSKLVLHLDDYTGQTGVNSSGGGEIYPEDHLSMQRGAIRWRLIV